VTTLIVGSDSDIAAGICQLLPDAETTSRFGIGTFDVDITKDVSTWPRFERKYSKVYYCIGTAHEPSDKEIVDINGVSSYNFLRYLAPSVLDGATVQVLSSLGGSIGRAAIKMSTSDIYYKMGKAVLNMGVIHLYNLYPNINWQLVDPGLTDTKMTVNYQMNYPKLSALDAARLLVDLPETKGLSFVNNRGEPIPW